MTSVAALEATLADVLKRLSAVEDELGMLRTKTRGGPKSDKPMTEEHAFRVRFGDLKDASHKEASEALGLSYGQVFSCRGGYTFKTVKANWQPKLEKPTDI
jgi:hypothetical protein